MERRAVRHWAKFEIRLRPRCLDMLWRPSQELSTGLDVVDAACRARPGVVSGQRRSSRCPPREQRRLGASPAAAAAPAAVDRAA